MVSIEDAYYIVLGDQYIQGLVVNGQWSWGGYIDPPVIYPPDIPGLLCWFSGSNFELDTSEGPPPVDIWYDSSGNGRHALQSQPGNPGIWYDGRLNGRPSLSFGYNGITDFVVDPGHSIGDRTIFQVVQIDPNVSPNGPFHALQLQPSSPFMRSYVRDGTYRTYTTPELDSQATPTASVQVITTWCEGSSGTQGLEVDGAGGITSWRPSSFTSATPFHLGGYFAGGYGMRGEIGEILIYERCLTQAERTDVQTYLAVEWRG